MYLPLNLGCFMPGYLQLLNNKVTTLPTAIVTTSAL